MSKAKIHRAKVTRANLHYEGSVSVDQSLLAAAGFLPYESVHIWNINTGERLETYVIPAERGSGEICLNGAAARSAQPGDLVIIASFCWMEEEAACNYHPTVIVVDDENSRVSPID